MKKKNKAETEAETSNEETQRAADIYRDRKRQIES